MQWNFLFKVSRRSLRFLFLATSHIKQTARFRRRRIEMAVGVNHFNHFPAFWGEKTSTLDWCEENYQHSKYIAEFCKCSRVLQGPVLILRSIGNSTSNFFFMYIALAGMLDTIRSRVPIRFTVLYGWLFIVGFGSLLFHATLKWSMQLLDEIPMIFMACQILHIL